MSEKQNASLWYIPWTLISCFNGIEVTLQSVSLKCVVANVFKNIKVEFMNAQRLNMSLHALWDSFL